LGLLAEMSQLFRGASRPQAGLKACATHDFVHAFFDWLSISSISCVV
jgi:hypothetical protein